MSSLDLSVVVPLYNEEDSVAHLYDRISDALRAASLAYEIVFVDDGSGDRTLEIATKLSQQDPRLRVVEFRANYGQTPAMAAGIEVADGAVIATMDGDLQNDPTDIPIMLEQLDEDTDMVVGWRKARRDKLLTRKVPSWIANWLIGKVTGVPIKDNGCSLKIYRARLIKKIPLYSEMHRFIPAMASIAGARVKEVAVSHHARAFGSSKYGLSRVYKVLLDLLSIKTIIGFAQRPLLWFGMLAVPVFAVGAIVMVAGLMPIFSADEGLPLPLVGTGVLLCALGLFLGMGGAVSELIYATGNVDLNEFSRLLARRHTSETTSLPSSSASSQAQ